MTLSLIVGCSTNEDGTGLFVQIRTIEGHKYIIYSNGGAGIIHAESCWCKGKTK